jgi:hypothetical protein
VEKNGLFLFVWILIFGIGGEIWNDGLSKNDTAFILAFRSFVLVGMELGIQYNISRL